MVLSNYEDFPIIKKYDSGFLNIREQTLVSASTVKIHKGVREPLGVSIDPEGVNFAICAPHATHVTLCLFDLETDTLYSEIILDPKVNRTAGVWHVYLASLSIPVGYAYKIDGPTSQIKFYKFDPTILLLDPYAISVNTTTVWDNDSPYQPLGVVLPKETWESDKAPNLSTQDLIIYEMHVRGFTEDSSSEVSNKGTFLGVIEKIPHLLELGVNAVELLPVHEFNEMEWKRFNPVTGQRLYQYWGYSTVNFFSLMNRFASSNKAGQAIRDFRKMVKALHDAGIEVILDVVFNHTAERDIKEGHTLSFRGIDNTIYYMTSPDNYLDFTGCGSTVNCNNPIVRRMILDNLRYWVSEMHVDGFRFDLASIFSRGKSGLVLEEAPIIQEIEQDQVLKNAKLIAEPWDAAGLYEVGNFSSSSRWVEWNGRYRDSVRKFIKGDFGQKGEFATRICGSEDLYKERSPVCSLNFITCHDGFTLCDLVSYNEKHNFPNGEDNRDGLNQNDSWNCGVEGVTEDPKILKLRERQMKNFHLALMISQGVPMLLMGDEYGHTKLGNNNTWCQDNTLNWFLWDRLKNSAGESGYYRFYKMVINLRKRTPLFKHQRFLKNNDIEWHGVNPFEPSWESPKRFIAFTLKGTGKEEIYIAFNASDDVETVEVPESPSGSPWLMLIDTFKESPEDIVEEDEAQVLDSKILQMQPYSAVLLKTL